MPPDLTPERVETLLLDANLAAMRFFRTGDIAHEIDWLLASWRLSNAGQVERLKAARERLESQ